MPRAGNSGDLVSFRRHFGTPFAEQPTVVHQVPVMIRLRRAVLRLLGIVGCVGIPAFSAVASSLPSGSVTLAWNPSISTNVVGYNIYYGVASGVYQNSVAVVGATATTATITGLVPGTTYYFAATAVDSSGVESPYSNETSYSVPASSTAIPNAPPTLDPLPDLTINENAGLQTVNLTGITSGATNETQTLAVTAASSDTGLIPNPAVNYTSPNQTGTISFTPAANNYGTAIITVMVNDGAASNNLVAQSFTVTVSQAISVSTGTGPTIQVQPQTQTAEAGGVVVMAARVTSASTPACHWFFNGNILAGCDTNRLCLTGVQASDRGTYTLVVDNAGGAVTSAPALLNVIAPVPRRPVPAVRLTAPPGTALGLDYADAIGPAANWKTVATLTSSNTSQFYFDVTEPLPPHRFYRAWQSGNSGASPALEVNFVPAITLTGSVGSTLRLDCINAIGPTNAWVTLDTVTLTNASQLYFDTSAPGQPTRLYRIVPVP